MSLSKGLVRVRVGVRLFFMVIAFQFYKMNVFWGISFLTKQTHLA